MSDQLPMPSDMKPPATGDAPGQPSLVEPPSAGLIVRLFLIPLIIVAVAVGVMFLIGRMAGGVPSIDDSLRGLRSGGGERTADVLLGPGSKQRYLWAKTLVDQMKKPEGMTLDERIKLSDDLIDIIDNHSKPEEGDVQHFLLLAIGRVWQIDPARPIADTEASKIARGKARDALIKYAGASELMTRKAAILAMVYWAGRDEIADFKPLLISRVKDAREDLDVRLAAVTVLGPTSRTDDADVLEALRVGYRDVDPRNVELVWAAAGSLAQLNQSEVADTILRLLDRKELSQLQYYDRESDIKNPAFRKLSEQEQQRILINTIIAAEKLQVPAVQERLKQISESDPAMRVREAHKK